MEGKPPGTPTSPHQPLWGPTCPTGQPGIQAGGRAGSHLALPGRHPGQLRRERRPDFRGRGPTAGAEGGPAPPPLACFLPEQRGCTSPVVLALLHVCTARTHCSCPPSAEGRLRPRRETLCPPRSSWGRTPGLASRGPLQRKKEGQEDRGPTWRQLRDLRPPGRAGSRSWVGPNLGQRSQQSRARRSRPCLRHEPLRAVGLDSLDAPDPPLPQKHESQQRASGGLGFSQPRSQGAECRLSGSESQSAASPQVRSGPRGVG